jgi:hypothetical protein
VQSPESELSRAAHAQLRAWRQSSIQLPTFVSYGIDCSDPDPANWTDFGAEREVGLAPPVQEQLGNTGGGRDRPAR